jgi:hypothetical protein
MSLHRVDVVIASNRGGPGLVRRVTARLHADACAAVGGYRSEAG